MKNLFKKVLKITIICSLLVFSSCEKDLYEDAIQNSSKNVTVTPVSLSSLDKTTSSKINEKIVTLKKLKNETNDQNKFQYNDILNAYIDTENGKLVNNDGKLYYTFPMFRESEEKLENIIFTPLDSGEMETYFAKYNVTEEEFKNLTIAEIQNLNPVFQKIDASSIEICTTINFTITFYPNCTWPNGDHLAPDGTIIAHCDSPSVVFAVTNCHEVAGGDGNGTNTSPASYNGPTGGTGGGGISTTPVLSPEQIRIKNFQQQLQIQNLLLFWNNPENSAIQSSVLEYLNNSLTNSIGFTLNTNIFPSDAVAFAIEAMHSISDGGEVDFEKDIIYSINKPCQKLIIKNTLDICSPFTQLINQTFNSTDKVNIKFTNGTNPNGEPAHTSSIVSGTPQNSTITINFDNAYLDHATDLSIVAVTLHELVHAYLLNLYYHGQLVTTDTNFNTLQNAFITFYNNQVQDTFDPLDNEIHNAMKDFINKMANSIYNYASSKGIVEATPSYCLSLAWGTMTGTDLFQTTLTNQEQITNNNIAAYEQDNLPLAKGTPCSN